MARSSSSRRRHVQVLRGSGTLTIAGRPVRRSARVRCTFGINPERMPSRVRRLRHRRGQQRFRSADGRRRRCADSSPASGSRSGNGICPVRGRADDRPGRVARRWASQAVSSWSARFRLFQHQSDESAPALLREGLLGGGRHESSTWGGDVDPAGALHVGPERHGPWPRGVLYDETPSSLPRSATACRRPRHRHHRDEAAHPFSARRRRPGAGGGRARSRNKDGCPWTATSNDA